MDNFYVFETTDTSFQRVVVMKTCESPFDFLQEISTYLELTKFQGSVIIDQLLHSGNSEERFIIGFFDGKKFQKDSFAFKHFDRRSQIREYICTVLRDEQAIIDVAILNKAQKRLIAKGCYI